ncbi:unnamed protein product [Parascedosporium putredinis]|uniref:Glutathione synthetase n=1 Tax=Parascedosporium putredinis TaxID=1442378 RepID=A0A9P1M6L2_9PEZI|nr:unnamed protein product [Parascedosporium putredinis]CAI7988618.1 unnamed protein product [Parascedosporium putredinis]
MVSSIPDGVTQEERSHLVQVAKDWAAANGLAIRPPPTIVPQEVDPAGVLAIHAPVTLFPSKFPARASSRRDRYKRLTMTFDVDDFVASLWKVHERVKQEGYAQDLSLGLFRSDYMVHEDASGLQIKQVEFNTIASSFGGLSTQTSLLHRFLAATDAAHLARGIAAAFRAYDAASAFASASPPRPRCVLFVTQDGERNVFDQRHLEYNVSTQEPAIPVFRLPYSEILQHTRVADGARRELVYTPPWSRTPSAEYEVAVVYYRAGYGPGDYPSQDAWEARFQVERSAAIKCPTILTQLAGMKKVQQGLADAKSLLDTFTNIYPMDASPAGLEARRKATDPELCKAFVLKPQRGAAATTFTAPPSPTHHPTPAHNVILRNGNLEEGGIISELGVYGTCLWNDKEILHNEEAGYLLRTKGDKSEEGGVAAGFGCMDSVNLVN